MVMLPQTVSLETAEINGTKVIKQMYADGSYGIQDDNTGCVKVYYPDGKKQWFLPIDGSYKLTAEEAPDGKMTFAQKDGIVNTEHLSRTREVIRYVDGYEFSEGWNYTVTEHLTDHKVTFYDGSIYNVSVCTNDNYIDSCGFDKTSQFTELKVRLDNKDEYGDDTIKISSEKSFDGSGHRWNSFGEAVYIKTVDGTEREWYDNGRPSYEKLPDGTEREWFEDGKPKSEKLPDGTKKLWYYNGRPSYEKLPDGTEREWYTNGKPELEKLPDGTKREWFEDGKPKSEKFADGTVRKWYDNGEPSYEKLADGTNREWFDNGKPKSEKLPDGTKKLWYDNGKPSYEKLADGTEREWFEDGKPKSEKLPDGTKKLWYDNGRPSYEKLPDGTEREWFEDGKPKSEKLPDGTERGWYADGSKKFEQQANGSRKEWHLNGKLSAEILCSDDKRKISEARYDETGKRTLFSHYKKDGKDDTRLYLAKQKVAQNNVDKGAAKGKIQKKLNPLVKAIKMHKALKEVDAGK